MKLSDTDLSTAVPSASVKDIFRVAGVGGDSVRGAKDQGVVFAEDLLQVLDGKVGRFHGGSH